VCNRNGYWGDLVFFSSFRLLYTLTRVLQTIVEHLSHQQLVTVLIVLGTSDDQHSEYPGNIEAVLDWPSIATAWQEVSHLCFGRCRNSSNSILPTAIVIGVWAELWIISESC